MNFGHALIELKAGGTVKRTGWNGKRQFLRLQVPTSSHSFMTEPYIYMWIEATAPAPDVRIPWLASQADMLADDWVKA